MSELDDAVMDTSHPDPISRAAQEVHQEAGGKGSWKDDVMNFLDTATGGPETKKMATGLVTGAASGLHGIMKLFTGDKDQAAATVRKDQELGAKLDMPGRKRVNDDSEYSPTGLLMKGAKYAGEVAQEHGASPGLSTAIETGIDAIPLAIGAIKLPGRGIPKVPEIAPEPAAKSPNPAGWEVDPNANAASAAAADAIAPKPAPELALEPSAPREVPASPSAAPAKPLSVEPGAPRAPMTPDPEDAVHPTDKYVHADPEPPTSLAEHVAQMKVRGEPIDQAVVSRHSQAQSLPTPVKLTPGQATQDVNLISDERNGRGEHPVIAEHFNEQNGALKTNIQQLHQMAAPEAPGANQLEHGENLIRDYKAIDKADVETNIRPAYKALEDANGGTFPIDGPTFVTDAESKLAKQMKLRYLPAEIKGDLDEFRDGSRQMTFTDFENFRTNLASEMRKADRAGDGNKEHALGVVRSSLEDLPLTGDAAALKPLADKARAAAKARFDRLAADPAYKAAVNDTVAADDFTRRFVTGGKAANLKAMQTNLATRPLAKQTIAASTIEDLANKAGVDIREGRGNFSQAGYNKKGLNPIKPKLNLLVPPEVAQHLDNLGRVAEYTQAQPSGSYVNNSNTFVAGAKAAVASTAEGYANVAAHGIPVGTWARKLFEARSDKKFVENTIRPHAGLGGGPKVGKPKDKP